LAMIWIQFIGGALLIIAAGVTLTHNAETLAKKFGLGAGWAGLLILPVATSLPELVSSVRAILINAPDLAAGNLFGSNLFNILIIALVDLMQGKGALFYRLREGHAIAASLSIILITLVGLGVLLPFPTILGGRVGLDAIILIGAYIASAKLLTAYEKRSLTQVNLEFRDQKVEEESNEILPGKTSYNKALIYFGIAGIVILFAGTYLTDAADMIALQTGLGRTFVGSIFLAIATSLPEVVTTSTAARQGKLDMAVGNIFGANMYNMFFFAMIDLIYLPGALLNTISSDHLLTVMMVVILTAVAITGIVNRSKKAIGLFGLDSFMIICGYMAAVAVLFFLGHL